MIFYLKKMILKRFNFLGNSGIPSKLYFLFKVILSQKKMYPLYLYFQTETETGFVTNWTTCATEGESENCECNCKKFRTGQFSETQNGHSSRIWRCFLLNHAFLPITLEHPDSFCSLQRYSKKKKKKRRRKEKKKKKKKKMKKKEKSQEITRSLIRWSMWLSLFHTGILHQALLCLSKTY